VADRAHYDYSKVDGDSPAEHIIDLIRLLDRANDYNIIYLSGREDSCRGMTRQWMDKYRCPLGPLFMRETGDHRPDYIIKAELFDAYIRGEYNVLLVLDDRNQVVNMWRHMGLTCLQVADGDF